MFYISAGVYNSGRGGPARMHEVLVGLSRLAVLSFCLLLQVVFSPDGRYLASASFDKSIKYVASETWKLPSADSLVRKYT